MHQPTIGSLRASDMSKLDERHRSTTKFQHEMQQLSLTYFKALCVDIVPLLKIISRISNLPLVVIGSGGSLSAAHHFSYLHQKTTGQLAKASTPFEFLSELPTAGNIAVCCLSAGGNNEDILSAFRAARDNEPAFLFAICGRPSGKLVKLAELSSGAACFSFGIARDGFLATHSLVAFSVLFSRAYSCLSATPDQWPESFADVMHPGLSYEEFRATLLDICRPLWSKDTLSVIYGPENKAAAVDIESKFVEAALGNVHVADLRNFAHGRHHWLAKRAESTSVLALSSTESSVVAEQTLNLLPDSVPVVHLRFSGSTCIRPIQALSTAMHVVALAGEARGIDPGRPGVPEFGRKIYHLRASRWLNLKDVRHQAIQRKMRAARGSLSHPEAYSFWDYACGRFLQRVKSAVYKSIVFDYDGTLSASERRFESLDPQISEALNSILRAGTLVGVASGRGLSLIRALREVILPKYWDQVLVGLYNGAMIMRISEEFPDSIGSLEPPPPLLVEIADRLSSSDLLNRVAQIELRTHQISIVPVRPEMIEGLWSAVEQIVRTVDAAGSAVVKTGHSIDVLAPGVSKLRLRDHIARVSGERQASILCIGDQGQWPGNDFLLLSHPWSLSVAEVSADPDSCWNFAPPGIQYTEATLHYLTNISVDPDGGVRLGARFGGQK